MGAVSLVVNNTFEVALFWVIFSFAYFGTFRIVELVAAARTAKNTGLLYNNVSIRDTGVLCKIHKYKTDQAGRGQWVSLVSHFNNEICPLQLAERYLAIRYIQGHNWLCL